MKQLSDEDIKRAAYQRNKLFGENDVLAHTRRPDADECIARKDEKKRVKEEIARELCPDKAGWDANSRDVYVDHEKYRREAAQVLSISINGKTLEEWIKLIEAGKVVELADDQSLPKGNFSDGQDDELTMMYNFAQEGMRKDNWKKVVGDK